MAQLYVPLSRDEVERLRRLAEREKRPTKDQAAWLIVDGLRRAAAEPAKIQGR